MEDLSKTIVGWLATLKAKKDTAHPAWKWIVGAVLAVVVFVVVSYLSRHAFVKWQELAKLKHQKDVLEQEKLRARFEKDNLQYADEVFRANKEIESISKDIDKLDKKIGTLTSNWELERAKINAIENWEGIDQYIRDTGHSK